MHADQVHLLSLSRLLAPLPRASLARLRADLELIDLPFGEIVSTVGKPIEFVMFPVTALVCSVVSMADGKSVEVCAVGRNGMLGGSALLGDPLAVHNAIVQVPGTALRIRTGLLQMAVEQDAALRNRLLRYLRFVLFEARQLAACNRLHTLEQRFARWLAVMSERVDADEFPLTHEFLGMLLGVQRAGVTIAARALYEAGLIRYAHGRMEILDLPRLERASCECLHVLQQEEYRLLG